MSNELDSFIWLVENADYSDDDIFCKILAVSESALNLSDQDLGKAIMVSNSIVTRWRNGRSVPHFLARKGVIDFLINKAIEIRKTR